MKRITLCIVAALIAALSIGAVVGCSPSQDQIISEYKDALANVPAYNSVTVTIDSEAIAGEDADDTLKATTVYKYDKSGDKLKSSMTGDAGDIKIQYFSEGDDAVCVTDLGAYSGTTKQFDLEHFAGAEACIKSEIGDISTLADCLGTIEKQEAQGMTFFTLTLDPEKYMASDETLTILAESGDPVKEAVFTIGFDEDGSLASIDEKVVYETSTTVKNVMFSDFDSTVVEPMPKADKTYEDMNAAMEEKVAALASEVDETEAK